MPELTERSFRRLLEFLDPAGQHSGERYEKIRGKLVRFFEWKGCIPGEDYADEVIDRVAKKVDQGMESAPDEPYLYFHGVAVNVIRERWRKASRDPLPLETVPRSAIPSVQPFEQRPGEDDSERRLGCLQDCIDRLTPASRELVIAYHLGGAGPRMGRRRGLAEVLNLPAGALRLRVYRIRRQLARCLESCVGNV